MSGEFNHHPSLPPQPDHHESQLENKLTETFREIFPDDNETQCRSLAKSTIATRKNLNEEAKKQELATLPINIINPLWTPTPPFPDGEPTSQFLYPGHMAGPQPQLNQVNQVDLEQSYYLEVCVRLILIDC